MKTNNYYKKRLRAYLVIAVFFIFLGLSTIHYVNKDSTQLNKNVTENTTNKPTLETPPKESPPQTTQIKKSVYIEIPFTVQAPNQRWNIHEESCEEAVALMYHYFLKESKLKDIPATTAHNEMLKMVAWQKSNYGKEPDLSIKAFGNFYQSYYGNKYKITNKATKDDIKEALSLGHPVIVPVMTHSLGNPNYGREDSYHLLLIKGYNDKEIITNDAGISKGKNYRYTWETMFKAIDAQTFKMNQGRMMIYFN